MQLKYKITQNGYNEIKKCEWIKSHFPLGMVGSFDSRELVRLLENTHYQNIQEILVLMNKFGEQSDDIGKRLLKCNDRMAFPRTLAELYMFIHLKRSYAGAFSVVSSKSKKPTHDFEVQCDSFMLKIEVYTPVDFYAYQLFINLLTSCVKNLQVNFGFRISIKTISGEYYYPFNFPEFRQVQDWLIKLECQLINWLKTATPQEHLAVDSPCNNLKVHFVLNEKLIDLNDRNVNCLEATRSTDTRLFFESSDIDTLTRSQWAIKIKDKLEKQQAGSPTDNVIRILLLNFAHADTSDFSFLKEQNYFNNIEKMIKALAIKIEPYPPYDAVIPCVLGLTCGFASSIILSQNLENKIASLLSIVHLNDPICDVPLLNSENIIFISKD